MDTSYPCQWKGGDHPITGSRKSHHCAQLVQLSGKTSSRAGHCNGLELPFPSVVMEIPFAAQMVSRSGPCMDCAPLPTIIPTVAIVAFTHSVRRQSNAVKFAHQSLKSPKISSRKGFLNGCPNISVNLITKYLNPSLGTAKSHLK